MRQPTIVVIVFLDVFQSTVGIIILVAADCRKPQSGRLYNNYNTKLSGRTLLKYYYYCHRSRRSVQYNIITVM